MNGTITIGREYGSERREVSEKLAQKLGTPSYDEELTTTIAKEGNIEASILEASDEVNPDLDSYLSRQVPLNYQIAMTQRAYATQAIVIRNLNDKGPCIIIGRCVDTILPDAVNIFVPADTEGRISRIISLNPGLAEKEAKASILAVDRRCKVYHEYYFTTQWGDMNAYDIYLNSGLTGVEKCLEAALTYTKYVK